MAYLSGTATYLHSVILNIMKGTLIYKSDQSKLEIYRSNDQITVSGKGKNEILRTFDLERVCSEISYSNEQKNMYRFMFFLVIALISYELYKYFFQSDPITWQDIAAVAIIIAMSALTYFTNDGFNGWLKFRDNQKEQLTISKEEFDELTNVLINQFKNEVS